MPRLSVIIPVKNGEKTLERALESTLRALPRDAEVVVFDDGSDDATPAILSGVSDNRLRVLSTKTSLGVAAALNQLIAVTDSEFIARMDADDVTLPGRFDYQRRAIQPAAAVNFTTVLDWYPDRRRITPAAPMPISARAFPYHLLLTNPVSHPTMFATRDAIERVGGYRQVPAEDYDLWMRLVVAGVGIRRLARPSLLYRQHPGQVTSSVEWRHASWSDPAVADAFAQLSSLLLGRPFPRLSTLAFTAGAEGRDVVQVLAEFSAAVHAETLHLPATERRLVLRRLAARTVDVRQRVAAVSPS